MSLICLVKFCIFFIFSISCFGFISEILTDCNNFIVFEKSNLVIKFLMAVKVLFKVLLLGKLPNFPCNFLILA